MFNFPELEEKILDFWQKEDIFRKTLAKASPKGPFVFYEGPPTANGKPGIHHVLARAFKDLIPRFKTMQGYLVERKAGWDTHGLPVELEVEKRLKISGKPGIEKYGVEKFNQECRQSVWQYQADWEALTRRIAFWLDLDSPYVTYHKDYIESLWWIFKKIHERGFLYQGHKVVPQCPRCGTALSSHEVAQGYKQVVEPSVYVKFKIKAGQKIADFTADDHTYILSWTTTPWTLPGNVALAIGKKYDYVRLALGDENLVLAKDRLEIIAGDFRIESDFSGQDLIGLEYEPLFFGAIPKETENYANAFKVYEADFVTTEDGTGVVHTAVMYGEDDYRLGTMVGLPKCHTVDQNGNFKETVGLWAGKFVKDKSVEAGIVKDLAERNLLFKAVDYAHDYPFCWRCDTPLLYYAKDSWFLAMSKLKQDLIRENKKINWVPGHIKEGRFGEWLLQVKDWAISRERYWGTPIPIWQCSACGEIEVIGSYRELFDKTKDEKILAEDFDPHRPYIDSYVFNCRCGQEMKRVPEVADCWFDSGAMPFAQHHYPFANKEKIESRDYYPADFIAEAIDQTRGWFYTMLAVGVLVGRGTSYRNVICLGHINDAYGKKMSKRLGNLVDPWEVIDKWGADGLRFHLYTVNQPGESKNFDIKNVESAVKKNFMILFNVLNFYRTYQPAPSETSEPKSENVLDAWILARLNQLISQVTEYLESYNIFSAARLLTDFIDDLSTWYLRRSRERFKSDNPDDKERAIASLGYCLTALAKVMAPFTPLVAEELYCQLGGDKESVHLADWPKPGRVDEKAIKQMAAVRRVVEQALAKRDEAGIKVRQPLNKLTIPDLKLDGELIELIKDEVNLKEVAVDKKLDIGSLVLDTSLTEELKLEGLYRELVRSVNQLRKEAGLTIGDLIEIHYQTESELIANAASKFGPEFLKAVLAREIRPGKSEGNLIERSVKLNSEEVWLALKK